LDLEPGIPRALSGTDDDVGHADELGFDAGSCLLPLRLRRRLSRGLGSCHGIPQRFVGLFFGLFLAARCAFNLDFAPAFALLFLFAASGASASSRAGSASATSPSP